MSDIKSKEVSKETSSNGASHALDKTRFEFQKEREKRLEEGLILLSKASDAFYELHDEVRERAFEIAGGREEYDAKMEEMQGVIDAIERLEAEGDTESDDMEAMQELLRKRDELAVKTDRLVRQAIDQASSGQGEEAAEMAELVHRLESRRNNRSETANMVERDRAWVTLAKMRYDNTGSLKRKNLAAEFAHRIDPEGVTAELEAVRREISGSNYEQDPVPLEFKDGKLEIPENGNDRRYVFVNMGELDRINKEGGGHAAGDAALVETAQELERLVYSVLAERGVEEPSNSYALYRASGNEFCLSLDGFDDQGIQDFKARIESLRPKVGEQGDVESPPLVAAEVGFRESIDLFNDLQERVAEGRRADSREQASREAFGLMLDQANFMLDIRKFEDRVRRVKEIIARGEEGGDAEMAAKFYENYMKKVFSGTPGLDSAVDGIEKVLKRFGEMDETETSEMAFEYARRNLGADHVSDERLEDLTDEGAKESLSRMTVVEARKSAIESGTSRKKEGMTIETLAEIREPSGLSQLSEKLNAYRKADAGLRAAQAELKRMHDAGQETQEAAEKVERLLLEHEIAAVSYLNERARRDLGTGLLERGVFYESLGESFERRKEEENGEPDRCLVFVDMGFLKYFDRGGGKDVGDGALKFAADLMERAALEAGVQATVYRYAGDEFAISIEGDDSDAGSYIESLERLKEKEGAVPQGKLGAQKGYFPTKLSFNYGVSSMEQAERTFEAMAEAGLVRDEVLVDAAAVGNAKAEIMVKIADKALEVDKAADRFRLLLDRLGNEMYAGGDLALSQDRLAEFESKSAADMGLTEGERQDRIDEIKERIERQKSRLGGEGTFTPEGLEAAKTYALQTDQMIAYSGKALFAEAGGYDRLMEWARSGKSPEELKLEIERFVEEKVAEAHRKEEGEVDLKERLIELEAEGEYFRRKLSEAVTDNERLSEENEDLKSRIEELRVMLERSQEERRGIAEQRKKVGEE